MRFASLTCALWLLIGGGQTLASDRLLMLASPDGKLQWTVEVKPGGRQPGCLYYRVSYKGRTVLADSQLGLVLQDAPALDHGLAIVAAHPSEHDETWKPVYGERSQYRDHYRQLIVDLQDDQSPPRKLQLVCRAYDEGIAFCYSFPQQPGWQHFTITAENTRFQFTGDHTTWVVYTAQGDYTGGKGGGGMMPLSKLRPGAERPLPVRVADDLYVALAEARLVDYSRMKFRQAQGLPHALESVLEGTVDVHAPYRTPWRVVMVADSPGQLLENNGLLLNLNEPCAWPTPRGSSPARCSAR